MQSLQFLFSRRRKVFYALAINTPAPGVTPDSFPSHRQIPFTVYLVHQ